MATLNYIGEKCLKGGISFMRAPAKDFQVIYVRDTRGRNNHIRAASEFQETTRWAHS